MSEPKHLTPYIRSQGRSSKWGSGTSCNVLHFYHTYIGLQCVRVHTFSYSIPPQSLKMAVGATSELCNYLQDRGFIGVNETGYIYRMFPGYCLKIFILFSSDKSKSLRIFHSIHFYYEFFIHFIFIQKQNLGSK